MNSSSIRHRRNSLLLPAATAVFFPGSLYPGRMFRIRRPQKIPLHRDYFLKLFLHLIQIIFEYQTRTRVFSEEPPDLAFGATPRAAYCAMLQDHPFEGAQSPRPPPSTIPTTAANILLTLFQCRLCLLEKKVSQPLALSTTSPTPTRPQPPPSPLSDLIRASKHQISLSQSPQASSQLLPPPLDIIRHLTPFYSSHNLPIAFTAVVRLPSTLTCHPAPSPHPLQPPLESPQPCSATRLLSTPSTTAPPTTESSPPIPLPLNPVTHLPQLQLVIP
ncbi:hypothetical protein KSP39_PZI021193 [Platanthera zijinensis]|uniref:Uncharacterized protein n=1 Tax=Platanthera zijinensis TaxID=2320716 RepID=A0AAP0FWN4_9ASPA